MTRSKLAQGAIEAIGLSTKATSIRAGLVACTGNVGCKFAASDTKRHAEEIAHWCEAASSSTRRSTSTSPAAIIPARSITSATSACSPARSQVDEEATRSRAITSSSAAASARTPRWPRDLSRREGRGRAATVERMLKAYLAHRASRERDVPRLRAPARDRRAEGDVRRGGGRMTFAVRRRSRPACRRIAPFTPEQRAWLNGFFAGLSRLDGDGVTPLSPAAGAALAARRRMAGKAAARRRRRRSALARPAHAAGRAHEARRRPAAARGA